MYEGTGITFSSALAHFSWYVLIHFDYPDPTSRAYISREEGDRIKKNP